MSPPLLQNPNNHINSYPISYQPSQGLNNYIEPTNQYQNPNPSPSKFFQQNFLNADRFQNYNPQQNKPTFLDLNQRDLLQGNINQSYYGQNQNQLNPNQMNGQHNWRDFDKNHLSKGIAS